GTVMTDNRLKVFCEAAECLNFSKAAAALGISQPAVSKHIAKLEEELGYALFVRYDKSIILTEKGEQLLKIARSILDKYAEIDSLKG
ncbi:MAG: LysR family transcriptional regulator, partial [Bacteroidales bacterium]|nr:LysR family transcriptional regulator [Bacteroidales bacterium]